MLKPLNDWVFILPEKEKEGLIKLPREPRPKKGKVVAVGPGRFNKKGALMPMDLRVGNRVFLGGKGDGIERLGLGGYEFEFRGVKYYAIREREVLGVL